MSKAETLRSLLARPGLVPAVGAHDALSARLIEAAGFPVVWSSSFTISAAQRAMPDVNLLTMTETLDAAVHIDRAVRVPVIADCDNGYGNAVNVVRTVEEYERAGIAGLCFEDNVFPKTCSLYPGLRRELASVEEHAGKIRAAKRAQHDPATVVIARTEALIAGWGMDEAVRRAAAYADAGADLVLMHSKAPTAAEVLEFMRRWDGRVPIVVVPTLYPTVTFEELEQAGVKVVIWANQVLRGAVRGIQETLATLGRTRQLSTLDPYIVTLEEIYRLVGVDEFKRIESEFLPRGASDVRAVVIAAGAGKSLLPLTEDRPKCMLDVKGRTLLDRQLETLRACGIAEIAVVRGYRKETVQASGVRFYDNDAYERTGELASLFAAEAELAGRALVLYGDVLFERALLERMLRAEGDVVIAVDRAWIDQREHLLPLAKPVDLVLTSAPPPAGRRSLADERGDVLVRVGQRVPPEEAHGEFVGLALFSPAGLARAREVYAQAAAAGRAPFHEAPSVETADLTDLLQALVDAGQPVTCVSTWKGWLDIDTFEDYQRAWAEVRTT